MRSAALGLAALALAGCGGSGGDEVTVFAAASLTEAFEELDPDARFNFAGSDDLATQLREGAEADVYASADPKHALALYEEGLVERPGRLVSNHVVVIVPRDNPAGIHSLPGSGATGPEARDRRARRPGRRLRAGSAGAN